MTMPGQPSFNIMLPPRGWELERHNDGVYWRHELEKWLYNPRSQMLENSPGKWVSMPLQALEKGREFDPERVMREERETDRQLRIARDHLADEREIKKSDLDARELKYKHDVLVAKKLSEDADRKAKAAEQKDDLAAKDRWNEAKVSADREISRLDREQRQRELDWKKTDADLDRQQKGLDRAIKEGELTGTIGGQQTLGGRAQTLAEKQYADRLANEPRNFFNYAFRMRGMEPPPLAGSPGGVPSPAGTPWRVGPSTTSELGPAPVSPGGVVQEEVINPTLPGGPQGIAPRDASAGPSQGPNIGLTYPGYYEQNPNVEGQYAEWRDARRAQGQDSYDMAAFRQHLIGIGAPDPGEARAVSPFGPPAAGAGAPGQEPTARQSISPSGRASVPGTPDYWKQPIDTSANTGMPYKEPGASSNDPRYADVDGRRTAVELDRRTGSVVSVGTRAGSPADYGDVWDQPSQQWRPGGVTTTNTPPSQYERNPNIQWAVSGAPTSIGATDEDAIALMERIRRGKAGIR